MSEKQIVTKSMSLYLKMVGEFKRTEGLISWWDCASAAWLLYRAPRIRERVVVDKMLWRLKDRGLLDYDVNDGTFTLRQPIKAFA